MAMDDATRAAMERLAAAFPQVEKMTGAEARAAVKAMTARAQVQGPPVARTEERAVPQPGGELRLRIYWPLDVPAPAPAIVYFHGGGFTVGDLDVYDASVRELCAAARAVVISADYRLAPEDPFPAAIEDAAAALRWTVQRAEALGLDPARVGVGGDSAGGNLAAVVALLARDEGIRLAHQLLIYPMLDPDCAGASHAENAEGYFLTEAAVRWYWKQYLDGRKLAGDPLVAPAEAELAGLAPATIVTAEYDPCRDDGDAFAEAMAAAGVPIDHRRAGGMFHGFFGVATAVPAVARFRDDLYRDVGTALRS
jgi:acetyl esterase/lipase